MINFRWIITLLALASSLATAEMQAVEKSLEAVKVVSFYDEEKGYGKIFAFSCMSCAPVSFVFYPDIKASKQGREIDVFTLTNSTGYSGSIFYLEKDKTAVRINLGEKSSLLSSRGNKS